MRYLVQQLKYRHNFACARLIGELMAKKFSNLTELPELIVPVPLHSRRFRHRGFNQAAEIGKPISRRLRIPLSLNGCRRTKDTDPQFGLTAKERIKNLRNAFEVKSHRGAGHVAIVDDVVTTGTTVGELARVLKKSGVKRIDVWSFARA